MSKQFSAGYGVGCEAELKPHSWNGANRLGEELQVELNSPVSGPTDEWWADETCQLTKERQIETCWVRHTNDVFKAMRREYYFPSPEELDEAWDDYSWEEQQGTTLPGLEEADEGYNYRAELALDLADYYGKATSADISWLTTEAAKPHAKRKPKSYKKIADMTLGVDGAEVAEQVQMPSIGELDAYFEEGYSSGDYRKFVEALKRAEQGDKKGVFQFYDFETVPPSDKMPKKVNDALDRRLIKFWTNIFPKDEFMATYGQGNEQTGATGVISPSDSDKTANRNGTVPKSGLASAVSATAEVIAPETSIDHPLKKEMDFIKSLFIGGRYWSVAKAGGAGLKQKPSVRRVELTPLQARLEQIKTIIANNPRYYSDGSLRETNKDGGSNQRRDNKSGHLYRQDMRPMGEKAARFTVRVLRITDSTPKFVPTPLPHGIRVVH